MKALYAAILVSLQPIASHAQLSGTYTVGGPAPDHATLTDAVNALQSQGAQGNVTFDIRPGSYSGQYTLGAIPGTPGTILFRNSSNGAQAVDLSYDASGAADNFIFRVDGTDGVHFEKLTFRPQDEEFARAIHFINAVEGITIEQCVFHGSGTNLSSAPAQRILVHCDQDDIGGTENPQQIVIIDNSFFRGSAAVHLAMGMAGAPRSEGLVITGNEFREQRSSGITINGAIGLVAMNGFSTTVGDWYTAIRTAFFDGGSQVLDNEIVAIATNNCTGIEVSNTQSTTGNMIGNNEVYVQGTGEVWGIAVFNLWGMKVLHNSVLVAAGGAEDSYALYHLSSFPDGQETLVRNNIFANYSDGPALYVEVPGNVATEDHNGLFSTGTTLVRRGTSDHATLAAYQSASGMGAGDLDIDPVFPAQPDLRMNHCTMDDAGQYDASLPTDNNGVDRSEGLCDMGAREFNGNIGIIQAPTIVVDPAQFPYELGLNAAFNTHQWSTGATTPTTSISAGGAYTCAVMDVNLCSYEVHITVIVEVGTAVETVTMDALRVHPNPASDVLFVEGVRPGTIYTILTMDGSIVARGMLTSGSAIDVQQLLPGAYLLRLDSGAVHRFIKR